MSSEKAVPKYVAPAPIDLPDRQWPSRRIEQAPQWCSVDLRDGNQALPNPMGPEQKLAYFRLLCDIGVKHIEVAFPSGSQDDFRFTRRLIEGDLIPEDVYIMVLSVCRAKEIARTLKAIEGIGRGIVHLYLATSELHIKQVFGKDRKECLSMLADSVRQVRETADTMRGSDVRFEFSPEEFTDSDLGFVLEACEAVAATWGKATTEEPLIINLPATVERRPPNSYADMIEWFCRSFSHRDTTCVSVHAHNDQGMAVAATELALLAGADRVEGTLFGHGERTGNVDLVTLANNLASRGLRTGLDFSDLPRVSGAVEQLTGIPIYCRQPYAGELVFTAFSGTHQDAIRKGMHKLDEAEQKFGMGW
ncbi:MAG: 2-isopropylmalate synthase, partial [Planctomycetota bacterium]